MSRFLEMFAGGMRQGQSSAIAGADNARASIYAQLAGDQWRESMRRRNEEEMRRQAEEEARTAIMGPIMAQKLAGMGLSGIDPAMAARMSPSDTAHIIRQSELHSQAMQEAQRLNEQIRGLDHFSAQYPDMDPESRAAVEMQRQVLSGQLPKSMTPNFGDRFMRGMAGRLEDGGPGGAGGAGGAFGRSTRAQYLSGISGSPNSPSPFLEAVDQSILEIDRALESAKAYQGRRQGGFLGLGSRLPGENTAPELGQPISTPLGDFGSLTIEGLESVKRSLEEAPRLIERERVRVLMGGEPNPEGIPFLSQWLGSGGMQQAQGATVQPPTGPPLPEHVPPPRVEPPGRQGPIVGGAPATGAEGPSTPATRMIRQGEEGYEQAFEAHHGRPPGPQDFSHEYDARGPLPIRPRPMVGDEAAIRAGQGNKPYATHQARQAARPAAEQAVREAIDQGKAGDKDWIRQRTMQLMRQAQREGQ